MTLSPANLRWIKSEPELPGLRALLDPHGVQKLMGDTGVDSVRPYYLRYKPKTDCLIGYHVSKGGENHFAYGICFPLTEPHKLRAKKKQFLTKSALGPKMIVDESQGLALWFAPNDRRLRVLAEFLSQKENSAMWGQLLPNGFPENGSLRPLAYKPERRFVAQCVDADGKPYGVVKFHESEVYDRLYKLPKYLKSTNEFTFAKRLGRHHHGVVATEWLAGDVLADKLSIDGVSRAAKALAALHQQKAKDLTSRDQRRQSERLLALAESAARLVPECETNVMEVCKKIIARDSGVSGYDLIHGDFHPGQVVIDVNATGILDLDRARLGNTGEDLGNFIAHLELESIREHLDYEKKELLVAEFVRIYDENSGKIPGQTLTHHTTRRLFHLLLTPFRECDPAWDEQIKRILARIGELLEIGDKPSRTFSPLVRVESRSKEVSGFEHCLDKEILETGINRFRACLTSTALPLKVTAAVLNERFGNRDARIDVEVSNGNETFVIQGIARSQKFDHKILVQQRNLWLNGLGPGSPLQVPQPLGTLPDSHLWFQRKPAGQQLKNLIRGEDVSTVWAKIQIALQRLQQMHSNRVPIVTPEDILEQLQQRFEGAGNAAVMKCILRLREFLPVLETPILCHGNLGIRSFVISDNYMTLSDLESLSLGHSSMDWGHLSASVHREAFEITGDFNGFSDRAPNLTMANLDPDARWFALSALLGKLPATAENSTDIASVIQLTDLWLPKLGASA